MANTNAFDLLQHPVEFVLPTKKEDTGKTFCGYSKNAKTENNLNGKDIKKFYEDLISEPSQNNNQKYKVKYHPKKKKLKTRQKCETKKEIKTQVTKTQIIYTKKMLLQAAQENNLELLQKCHEIGCIDVNCYDHYNWTPLMIASYAGFKDIVDYLLLNGARWIEIFDGRGYDARELACLGGNDEIAKILSNRRKYVKQLKTKECMKCVNDKIKKENAYCETCEYSYTLSNDGSSKQHDTSILHKFSLRQKDANDPKNNPHYFIQHTNQGYQLLKKSGWDEVSGLGPSGVGNKYPVKTVLKRDRLGLGSEDAAKPRVTHFAPYDKSAVRHACLKQKPKIETKLQKLNKKKLSQKEIQQKQNEIDFRMSFNYE